MHSKKWVGDPMNREKVLHLYRSKDLLTMMQVAERIETSVSNVIYVLNQWMPDAERRALSKVRYSASKTGSKNPMLGKTGSLHHAWVGECDDGKGYLTCIHKGMRQFVHHVVMMQALGLEEWPENLEVHHIDSDPKNNSLDNLALVTDKGHKAIHYLQVKDSIMLKQRKLSIADALKYMT